ncbi:50S ribosomal protein L17 [Pseudogracilibacillus sp. SO10305]|uniref:50S ribosomal protein L17 n=1 Tax=Pseudogracilibacillus sp. SO10305 TaxID=3098292 RepID=UPI00300DDCC1
MARKLGRSTETRMALLRNLTTDVIVHERVETTEAKAKELRSTVDKMITLGKRGDLHARRQAAQFLYKKKVLDGELIDANKELVKEERDAVETVLDKLFGELAERYEDRQGGYTRVLKVGPRRGDGANIAIIELV